MAIRNDSIATHNATSGVGSDILNKNMLLTAGVLVGSGTAIAGGVLLTAVLPAQMLTAGALTGGLIYAGHRQDKGLGLNPFAGKSDGKKSTSAQTEEAAPASEPQVTTEEAVA